VEAANLRSLRFREKLSEVLILYFKNKGLELWRCGREGMKGNLSALDRRQRVSFDVRRTKSVKGKITMSQEILCLAYEREYVCMQAADLRSVLIYVLSSWRPMAFVQCRRV
jgi:hypothetical protein